MQNSARQTVSRMYMPFLNDLKILPANPTQNYSVHNFIMLTSANTKGVLWFFQAYFLFFYTILINFAYVSRETLLFTINKI